MGWLTELVLRSFLAFVVVASAFAQQETSSQPQPTPTQGQQITLSVTVTDRQHRPIEGLSAANFKIYEDDQARSIVSVSGLPVPACMGMVVDTSGSMRYKSAGVISALLELVRARAGQDSVFIVNFNDQPYLDTDFTKDLKRIESGLNRGVARGGTALYDALMAASEHLSQRDCPKRVLVAVTDGQDNESRFSSQQLVDVLMNPRGPIVYALGLPNEGSRAGDSRRILEKLTANTGGDVFFVQNRKDMEDAVHKLASELDKQYLVTYTRPNTQSTAASHTVRVEIIDVLERKDIVARTRAGMNAGMKPNARPASPDAPVPPTSWKPSCIAGSVVDDHHHLLSNMRVEAWSTGKNYKNAATLSDQDGKFRIDNIPPGLYTVFTWNESEGYPPTSRPFYQRPNGQDVTFATATEKCDRVSVKVGPKAARLRVNAMDATTHRSLAHFRIVLRRSEPQLVEIVEADPEHDILLPARIDLTIELIADGYEMNSPVKVKAGAPETVQEVNIDLEPRSGQASSGRTQTHNQANIYTSASCGSCVL